MLKRKKSDGLEELHEVKGAGFTVTKKVKRDITINRRAGLHDKVKYLQGETRVKRCKPLGLKHVRRMRKFAAVASLAVVCGVAVFGVGFFTQGSGEEGHATILGHTTGAEAPPTDPNAKPTDRTLYQNVKHLNYVLGHQDYWSSESRTDVYPVVNVEQYVKNYKKYYKGVMISADCSYSPKLCTLFPQLQYGEQFCQYTGDAPYKDCILTRRSTSNKKADLDKGMYAPWSKTPTPNKLYKKEEFMEKRGYPPFEFSGYLLDEQTIINANDYSVIDNCDGTYSMTLKLNVSQGEKEADEENYYADHYYKVQMHYNGGLLEDPIIYSTSLTYTFDGSWRVLKLEVDDSYHTKAVGGIDSDCTSHTVTNYSYEEADAKNTFWEDYYKAEFERLRKQSGVYEDENKEEPLDAGTCLASAFGSVMTEGAIFKVGLSLDALDLNGAVAVEMKDGGLSGFSANLGDILVWLDGKTLYINDGSSKYKLNTDDLSSSKTGEEGVSTQGLTDGLNLETLLGQLAGGEFVHNEETGVATLNSDVELFGLKIALKFEFQKTEDGVELNFLKAEIPIGEKVVKANLSFGTENDKPAIPEDTTGYQDILNDGITLDISLNANGFTLGGIAKIIMQNGKFTGAVANLENITVYYDYPHSMLYLSVGNAKYKLDISKLNTGAVGAPALLGSFDINSILNEILSNLTASETSLGTSLNIDIDALDSALKAALNIQLFGGLKVDADLTVDKLNVSLSAALSNKKVDVPELKGYQDVLNGDVTFDASLTLITGLADTNGNYDEVTLEGQVALCLKDGALTEIRADFGGLAVYFDFSANELYVRVGTTKVMLNLDEMDLSDISLISLFAGGESDTSELSGAVKELLSNLVGDAKVISTNATLACIPVWAELDLSEGLSVRAGLTILGIDAKAQVKLSETVLDGLSAEEKEEYIDVLKEGHKVVESLIGNHISATVEGTLYSNNEKYAEYGNEKYSFKAALEYEMGTVNVNEEGIEIDSNTYLHLNIGLTAQHPDDDSLYIDLVLMDANPVTGEFGKTTGGYVKDGNLDIYLSVSKYENSLTDLKIYAPVDEILNIVSMVGATANLNKDSEELPAAVGEIAKLLDVMLISKYLPKSVQDKFASLGDSLIPQILGVSLEELLNGLFGNAEKTVDKAQGTNFSLSDEYVSSIKTTDESLIFVLNSSLIYNSDIDAGDNLVVTFDRVLNGDVYFVGGISIENVFFGENQSNKLNLNLTLGYDEILKPDEDTAFLGYLNADGLDDLLNGIVNSATHSKDIATDREKEVYGADITDYILNHYYYLNGQLTAKLNVIDIVKVNIVLDLVGVSVTIDEETNDVAFSVRLHYDALTARAASADYIVINGESCVDLTLKNGMLYIKRTQFNYLEEGGLWATIVGGAASAAGYELTPAKSSTPKEYATPVVTYRVYDLENFGSDMNEIMDLVSYVLNLDHRIVYIITDSISNSDGSSYVKTDTSNYDFGDWQNYYLKTYVYTDDNNGNASWKFTLNGTFLSDIMGMTVEDPVITFNATYTLDENGRKSFIVHNLDISDITIKFVEVGSNFISMSASGTVNYLNPQLVMKQGYKDETNDTSPIWEEVFGCSSKEITSTGLWTNVLDILGTKYLSVDMSDANAPVKLGELKFTLSGEPFGEGKNVLYNDAEVLSGFAAPIWPERNGYTVTTVFDASTVTVAANYVANAYNVTLDFGELSVPEEVISYTYGEDLNLSEYFGKTYADEDGTTWKIVRFTLDGTAYDEGNPVINSSVLAEIYCKDVVLNVVCEEMENDTATHLTLTSTVDFSYTDYDGTYKLLNIDLEDGADYTVADATAEGYTFLGWWYNDNGDWRKITSVEEFAVEGAASFVTLEALWVKVSVTGSATTAKGGFLNSEIHYTVSADSSYEFAGSEAILADLAVKSVQYKWYSYSWSNWNERGNYSTEDCSKLSYTFDTVKSNGANKFESWRVNVVFTLDLPDGTSTTVSAEQEANF